MTPEQFCFWLHGFFELTDTRNVTEEQAQMIREHLDLVFTKVTPPLKKKPDLLKEEICEAVAEMKQGARFVPSTPGKIC